MHTRCKYEWPIAYLGLLGDHDVHVSSLCKAFMNIVLFI